MKTIKLDESTQHKIIEYMAFRQNEMDAQQELEALMDMISPNLKHLVT